MKFPAAIIALTVGITGASAANRRSRRQAKAEGGAAAAASAWEVPVSNRARRRAGAGMGKIKCVEEEFNGMVHLCFPDDKDGDTLFQEDGQPPSSFEVSTGFGGFAFEYDSDSQKVEFKGAAGSAFDFNSCMEYQKKKTDEGCGDDDDRRMQEDVIEEDRRSYCDGDDTVLYCPMTPGQCATFELTETVEDCQAVPNSSGSGSNSGSGSGDEPNLPDLELNSPDFNPCEGGNCMITGPSFDGFQLHVTTPRGRGPSPGQPSENENETIENENETFDPGCYDKDAVAALQCAPNSNNDFIQTSECLYGDNNGPESLGLTYWLSLQSCSIDADFVPSPTPPPVPSPTGTQPPVPPPTKAPTLPATQAPTVPCVPKSSCGTKTLSPTLTVPRPSCNCESAEVDGDGVNLYCGEQGFNYCVSGCCYIEQPE